MEDKQDLLKEALEGNWIIYFDHDPIHECCTVKKDKKGKIVIDKIGSIADLMDSAN